MTWHFSMAAMFAAIFCFKGALMTSAAGGKADQRAAMSALMSSNFLCFTCTVSTCVTTLIWRCHVYKGQKLMMAPHCRLTSTGPQS